MKSEIDPKVKKAIWKIVIYAVSVIASLFAGNSLYENGVDLTSNSNIYVQE